MKPLSFKCPHCGGWIEAGIENVLEVGFCCGRCEGEIRPDQVFCDEDISFPAKMAEYLAEAGVNYYRLWMRELNHWKETKTRDQRLAFLTMRFHMEMMRRIALFVGDNLAELNIGEVGDIFETKDGSIQGLERDDNPDSNRGDPD